MRNGRCGAPGAAAGPLFRTPNTGARFIAATGVVSTGLLRLRSKHSLRCAAWTKVTLRCECSSSSHLSGRSGHSLHLSGGFGHSRGVCQLGCPAAQRERWARGARPPYIGAAGTAARTCVRGAGRGGALHLGRLPRLVLLRGVGPRSCNSTGDPSTPRLRRYAQDDVRVGTCGVSARGDVEGRGRYSKTVVAQ